MIRNFSWRCFFEFHDWDYRGVAGHTVRVCYRCRCREIGRITPDGQVIWSPR
jgi:hypothetical protein